MSAVPPAERLDLAVEPVLALCAPAGTRVRPLAELVVLELARRGLRVGVLPPGPMPERSSTVPLTLDGAVARLLDENDLVLVEGCEGSSLPKLWLDAGGAGPPSSLFGVVATVEAGARHPERLLAQLEEWLAATWARRPLWGGVLVGGAGRRMGRPKPTARVRGRTLVELVVRALEPHVEQVVLLGRGPCPEELSGCARLNDAPGCSGPLAGLLAAQRLEPRAAWVIAACDLPLVTPEAIAWLVSQRAFGRWAVMPRLRADRLEPLLAVYEPQARPLLERLASAGGRAPRLITANGPVYGPRVPPELARAWTNVNTPEELALVEEEEKGEANRTG